jgi:hypothetical protein
MFLMRARIAIALLGCLGLLAVGCGGRDEATPVACLEGANAYLKALEAAPGEVTLGGEASISDCLAENQQAGNLATVGTALLEAATRLNAEARAKPGGDAALRLGYLIGAVKHGAEDTEGIHSDLVRRLLVAARFAPGRQPLSQEFLDAYRRGFDAGREAG